VRRSARSRSATAFAPGHITGFFRPEVSSRGPLARGSVGAGLVLELGVRVRARWTPRGSHRIVVRTDSAQDVPISREVARRLFARGSGRLEVWVRNELPVGQGFGTSAAGALATGLAVGRLLGVPRQRAIAVAHLADLHGLGGLGGVAAILGGGLESRRRAGIPPYGVVRHQPFPHPVTIAVLGRPLPSPRVLGDPKWLRRVDLAARPGLETFRRGLGPEGFLREAERFSDAVALGPESVSRKVRSLRRPGLFVAQTMFGRAIWAVATRRRARERLVAELERHRVAAVELRPAKSGPLVALEWGSHRARIPGHSSRRRYPRAARRTP